MRKFAKRFLIALICILIVGGVGMRKAYASEGDISVKGRCGSGSIWRVVDADNDGTMDTLYIDGAGRMYDYEYYDDKNNTIYSTAPWFAYYESIISIIIDDRITYIGDNAFLRMEKVSNLHLPKMLKEVGEKSFERDLSLTDLKLPDGIEIIGVAAFRGLPIKRLVIPDSVRIVKSAAFNSCNELTNITLSIRLRIISDSMFSYCTALENFKVPDQVSVIENKAFYGCRKLSNLDLNNVVKIGTTAFSGCESLKNINIPDTVDELGDAVFEYCSSLENATVGENVYSLPLRTFYECTSLNNVKLPEKLREIGDSAFYKCTSLEKIDIPEKLTSIRNYAFDSCTSLKTIKIPDSVTTMERCFAHCTSLVSVNIPSEIYSVENGMFAECTSLREISIPVNINSIGNFSLSGCTGLKKLKIYNSDCSISSVIDAGMGENTFASDLVICGSKGSTAETFANERGFQFEEICIHNGGIVVDEAIEPTCTQDGYTKGKHCGLCGDVLKAQEKIPALGHVVVVDDAVPATCTTEGLTSGSHCMVCDTVFVAQKKIDATGHNVVMDKAVAATCEKTGLTEGCHCSLCGKVLVKQTKTPATGHSWGGEYVSKEATVLNAKTIAKKCANCGKITTRTVGNKLTAKATVKVASAPIQIGKSSTVFGITSMAKGDYVVSWKASNSKAVTIAGQKNGICRITAGRVSADTKVTVVVTLKSGLKKSFVVIVQKKEVVPTGITGVSKAVTIQKGKTMSLKPVVQPVTASQKVQYASSNTKAVTVSTTGKVTAKARGTAKITITAGSKKIVCTVTVK